MGLRPTHEHENSDRPRFTENKRLNARLSTERSDEESAFRVFEGKADPSLRSG
jgi:hypothetical protein